MTPGLPERIGRYEVLGPLGQGGMGLVYLARDETLERDVAIKVLPDEVARDPERLAWFAREAKALAALNHPHIATIHGFESAPDGTRFLVLERIAGTTLAERLRGGPLPPSDAIGIVLQIADALATAHEHGIIHRDLKPGNVMVTRRGRVKLLDFGLALRVSEGASGAKDASPALGTPGYASPEQIRGETADHRADIFALGSLLFECLTGRRAFGSTGHNAIDATIRGEPNWEGTTVEITPGHRALISRCLEKRPADRPATMSEVLTALADLPGSPAPVDQAPSFPAAEAAARLPTTLTRFIGRKRELSECDRLFGGTRLLTLTGVAGCGKTRIAIEVARARCRRTAEDVHFVDLAPLRNDAGVIAAFATAVGVKESAGLSLEAGVADALRRTRTVLLVDNCEHLVAPLAALALDLLQSCPGLSMLATSLEALNIPGEQIFHVEPFPLPNSAVSGPQSALESESVQLFVERARVADSEFALGERNVGAVVEICRRLEGIPLALELAAARLPILSLEQIRSRLEDRFRLLSAPTTAFQRHHRTLHEAIRWSHDLMTEVEQVFFRRLAVFSAGWTLEAATSVTGDDLDEFVTLDLLTRLWNKSLLVVDRGDAGREPRYRYLETVREFALERLAESGEEFARRDRHLEHFMALAERTYPLLGSGTSLAEGLTRLGQDHHNLLEALAWCERAGGRDAKALFLVSHLWSFWMDRCAYTVGRRALSSTLDRPGAAERTALRCRALYGAGWLASLQGDSDVALARMEESLAIALELPDLKAVSRALAGLGVVAMNRGDFALARSYAARSLEMNRSIGNTKGMAAALTGLGNLAFQQGDFEGALTFMEETLELHRSRDDQEGIAGCFANLSETYIRLGRIADAKRAVVECFRMSRLIQAKHITAAGLANTGALASGQGDAWIGARLTGAAESLWTSIGYALASSDRESHERVLAGLASALGAKRMERARREGAALSMDEAVEGALRYLEGPDPEASTR